MPAVTVSGRLTQIDTASLTLADASTQVELHIGSSCTGAGHLAAGDVISVDFDPQRGAITAITLLSAALRAPAPVAEEGPPFDNRCPGGGASLGVLKRRSQLLHALRTWFVGQGFTEVETPSLAFSPGLEPHLDPFETRWRPYPGGAGHPLYLLTSPEYAMKRLVVGGLERCFQLSRVYRNGEAGPFHNPEFTMLEWYRAFASYQDILVDTQDLILHVARAAGHQLSLKWGDCTVDLSPPWPQLTVQEATRRYAGIELEAAQTKERLYQALRGIGMNVPEDAPWDELFFQLLMEKVEPHLGIERPTFLIDYPAPLAALAQVRAGAYPVAERFELYIAGVEIANAFSELTDPTVQRQRFADEQGHRQRLGAPVFEADEAYLAALEQGLPPTGGIALGVDRLMMVLLGAPDLRSVMAFPFSAPG